MPIRPLLARLMAALLFALALGLAGWFAWALNASA